MILLVPSVEYNVVFLVSLALEAMCVGKFMWYYESRVLHLGPSSGSFTCRDLDTAISLRMLAGKVSVTEGCFHGDVSYVIAFTENEEC